VYLNRTMGFNDLILYFLIYEKFVFAPSLKIVSLPRPRKAGKLMKKFVFVFGYDLSPQNHIN